MNGVLNLDKPAGMTSHDVVGQVRRIAQQKRVGHAGTLDPDATGVLLVCLGSATRLSDYLADEGKRYRATLALGVTTTTEDASGDVVHAVDASHVTDADVQAVLPRFLGMIFQVPPMVSAVHHEGRRLYALAREGIVVERQARPIQITELQMRDFHAGRQARATLDVVCGKGTYIRTLCADIGAALGVGGHMADLRRMQVGSFCVAESVTLDALTPFVLPLRLVPPAEALKSLEAQSVDDAGQSEILHGRSVPTQMAENPTVRVLTAEGHLLALARAQDGRLQPFKVFHDAADS